MQPDAQTEAVAPASEEALGSLSPPMRDLLLDLLVFKSVFMGRYFRQLGESYPDPEIREAISTLADETTQEALGTVEALQEWDRYPQGAEVAAAGTHGIRARLFQDLIVLKEGSNQVVLAAAMRAPTEELRRRLVDLADIDREHADRLRRLLGLRAVPERLPLLDRGSQGPAVGAHGARIPDASLVRTIEVALQELEGRGVTASRLVLSATGLRHLRDEGGLDTEGGTAFGLAVDVDLGWEGECFAFVTRDRVSLAEFITTMRARDE